MAKFIVLIIGCLALLTGTASAQEVVIKDFPLGVGGSAGQDFFKPHYADLQAVADTLQKYSLARAVITGGADGVPYRQNNDAKNPAVALGRAHALRDLLISEFKVDSTQLVIYSEDVKLKGGQYRYASVRVARDLDDLNELVSGLTARVDSLANRPPDEKHFTEVREITNTMEENLGLQFGAGLSSSPFGAIPVASAAFTWKKFIYIEGMVGHTFWNGSFEFEGVDLDTKRRLIGGHAVIYPYENIPVGVVGGWLRVEEIAQDYYEYTKLSEGLVLGLRATPYEFISITGAYNPSKQRVAGDLKSASKNGQFMIYLLAHIAFGGAK